MGALRLGVVLVALLGAGASPAAAGTASVTDGVLAYMAASGEPNNVTITRGPDAYRVMDLGAIVTAGAGCTSVTPNQAECTARLIERVRVELGDLNDFITISISRRVLVRGGDGNDVLEGGQGDDDLIGDAGADTLRGGVGIDALYGGLGADTISGGTGLFDGEFDGEEDFDLDFVFYSSRKNPVTVTLDDLPGDGEAGENDNVMSDVEVVFGGLADDNLRGNDSGLNGFIGGAGADRLFGGAGNLDVLFGEDGDDILRGSKGFDVLIAGRGRDRMFGDGGHDFMLGGPGDDYMKGMGMGDLLFGQEGRDTMVGGSGGDRLYARDGLHDLLFGGPGRDAAWIDSRDSVLGVERRHRTAAAVVVITTRYAAEVGMPGRAFLPDLLRRIEHPRG